MRIGSRQELPGWQCLERGPGVFTLAPAPRSADEVRAGIRGAGAVARAVSEPMKADTLAGLCTVEPDALSDDMRLDLIQAWERADAWLQAHKQRALASVAQATIRLGQPGEAARFEVGAALRLSPQTAQDRCWVAAQLTTRLAETLAAMQTGAVSYWQAHRLAHGTVGLTDEQVAAVQTRVLATASGQSLSETKRAIARAVLSVDPDGAGARARERARDRQVIRETGYDGSATLTAYGPAAAIDTMFTALSATALGLKRHRQRTLREATAPVDPVDLTMDACRFDTLATLCTRVLADPGVPAAQHARPAVQVSIDLATLLGLADQPGELLGHGPIPAAIARELAAGGDWTRFLTSPTTGELLDLARDTYRPSAALARFIVARDRTCRFPGCTVPATHCDLDHVAAADRGGPTTRANLAPHCRQHHNAKTHGGWRLTVQPDTTLAWTSPMGGHYPVPPTRHVTALEPEAPPSQPLTAQHRAPADHCATGSDPPPATSDAPF
jgi:hypothetical protein